MLSLQIEGTDDKETQKLETCLMDTDCISKILLLDLILNLKLLPFKKEIIINQGPSVLTCSHVILNTYVAVTKFGPKHFLCLQDFAIIFLKLTFAKFSQ